MQAVDIHEEYVILGTTRYRMDWLLRQMNKGLPGMEGYESHHNLIFHFFGVNDPAFPDRVRMAWKASGLNTKVAIEILPPIEIEGDKGTFKTDAWDVILENIDPCYAQAVKQSFVDAMINAYRNPEQEAPAEDAEAEEEGPEYDPHGIGLVEKGAEKEQPDVEENPYDPENNPYAIKEDEDEIDEEDAHHMEEKEQPKIKYPIEEEEEKKPDDEDDTGDGDQEEKDDPYSDDNYDPHAIGLQSKKKPEDDEKEA